MDFEEWWEQSKYSKINQPGAIIAAFKEMCLAAWTAALSQKPEPAKERWGCHADGEPLSECFLDLPGIKGRRCYFNNYAETKTQCRFWRKVEG